LKNVFYNAGIAHEKFRNEIESELHPVSNLTQKNQNKLFALVNNINLYSLDPLSLSYEKISDKIFNENKKPYHGCATVSDNKGNV